MNQSQLRSPWLYSKAVVSLVPAASIVAAVNGAAIDRTGYDSLISDVDYAVAGAPTAASLSLQLQDSADGVTFANFASPVNAALGALGVVTLPLDIRGARQFVRVVATPSLTGGNSPSVALGGAVRLHGPQRLPAA